MLILLEFVTRLALGMAAALLLVPSGQVYSAFFRNKHYVLLGLCALAAIVAWTLSAAPTESTPSSAAAPGVSFWPPALAALAAYAGAVCWLYEKPRAGTAAAAMVGMLSLVAAWQASPLLPGDTPVAQAVARMAPLSGGLLLGAAMTAMLLGHWHLNAPGMPLGPLRRMIGLLAGAVLLQAVVSGWGLGLYLADGGRTNATFWLFVSLRWLGGLAGTGALAFLSWETLKIPNTQSATGILYVAVITTFLGELTALLLAARDGFAA